MISVDSAEEKIDHFTWFTIFGVSFYISDVTLDQYNKATEGEVATAMGAYLKHAPAKAKAQELRRRN